MNYRKLTAEYLFTGTGMRNDGAVLVLDKNGVVEAIVHPSEAGDDVEKYTGIISPGFINCHCHLELSHLRGIIPERSGMVEFLLSVMSKRSVAGELIAAAIGSAEKEMIGNGIVAAGDICNTAHTLSQKQQQNIYYHNFIEASGFIDATAASRFEAAFNLYQQFLGTGTVSIVPHAPYSVSSSLFEMISNFKEDALLTMHNQESEAENEFYFSGAGDFVRLFEALGVELKHFSGTQKTSFTSVIDKIGDSHKMILVHNVLTGEDDLQHVRTRLDNLYWCFCVNANKYINGIMPNIKLIKNYSDNIVLGTDSLASNHQLSILEEIKTIQEHFHDIPLMELLKWATINGARALNIEDKYGSFEMGKRPGVVHIDGSADGGRFAARSARLIAS